MGRMTSSGIPALFEDYRRFAAGRLWLALGLMIAGAAAEGFGLLMIVPLAGLAIARTGGESLGIGFSWLPAALTAGQWFAVALFLFVAAMGLRALVLFARDVLLARLQAEYESDLRIRAAATLAARGWPFASSIGQDGMQALLLTDVPRAAQAAAFLQNVALSGIMLTVQFGLALLLSPALAGVALFFMALACLLSARAAMRGVDSGFAISESMGESTAAGFRLHAGLKSALAQGAVTPFIREYGASLLAAASQYSAFARTFSQSRQMIGFGAALAAALLLLIGVQGLALPFPMLIASLVLFARMNAPAQMLQNSVLQAAAYAPSFAAIERRLGVLKHHVPEMAGFSTAPWHCLRVKEVTYRHPSGRGLDAVSCVLNSGEWLALIGVSGAGKTTFVDLVAGLLQPQSGSIEVDDRQLAPLLSQWQAGIAYVGQDSAVFNDSIRGNLLPPEACADAFLWQALDTVGLADRVRFLPAGLDEQIGDRGSQLSGGERQRLVIARALLRKPTLLILDEATAALDAESEAEIIGRLRALEPRPAALVIAHRESTLAHCDRRLAIQHDHSGPDTVFVNETTSARINVAKAKCGGQE